MDGVGLRFLVSLFLLAQLVVAAGVAGVFAHYDRVYRQPHLRWWAASFAALALASLAQLALHGWVPLPDAFAPLRPVVRALRHALLLVHAVALLRGAWCWRQGQGPRALAGWLLPSLAAGLAYALAVDTALSRSSSGIAYAVLDCVVGLAFLGAAVLLARPSAGESVTARRVLVVALTWLGLWPIAIAAVTFSGVMPAPMMALVHWSGAIDLVATLLVGAALALGLHHVERERAERADRALSALRDRDDETGLPNRAALLASLSPVVDASGAPLLLVCLGIERAAALREAVGHEGLARIARAAATRLLEILPAGARVARLDESRFALALSGEPAAAVTEAETVLEQLRALPAGPARHVGWCAGVALWPDDAIGAPALIEAAEAAQAWAEARGTGLERYAARRAERHRERIAMAGDLRRALIERELKLHHQPVLSLRSDRIAYSEALLRWRHPEAGLLEPGAFFEAVSAAALETEIDRYVVETACRWLAASPAAGPLAINLFAGSLHRAELAGWIEQSLARHGVDPARLEIEITEAAALRDTERAAGVLARLRALGVRIALDDFGTGHSSMARLKALPADKLKIDRGFVAGLLDDERDLAIVRAMVELGHSLGLEVVAEGIETASQLAQVRALGVDYAQGHHIGHPRPPAMAEAPALGVPGG